MAPIALEEQTPGGVVSKSKVEAADESLLIRQALAAAQNRYVESHPNSKRQHEIAVTHLPGGNTRTVLHTSPFPLTMKCGKGPFVWDEDGHKYLDLVGELSAGIYGHSHPVIREAIVSTFDDVGLNLGSTTSQENKYAALICERFYLERVRFANSGTEANMHAFSAARVFTGKKKIAVFSGGYHGAVFTFGGGKVAQNAVDRDDWVIGKYNDVQSAKAVIEDTPGLAAVVVEAMQGAGGGISGTEEFLFQIQDSAKKVGAVFILDEVMTSRLAPHGLQEVIGLKPDLVTLGKYLGGGFAFGAFGGRSDIMAVYDPRLTGAIAHSGTFNNNTMTMYVGYAGLSKILTPETNVAFNAKGDKYRHKLQEITKGTKCTFTGRGALWCVHFTDTGPEDIKSVEDVTERMDLHDLFWFELLEEGFWIHRRGSMALIMDTPDDELDRFVDCVEKFLERHKDFLRV
ncbi:glutamate-1-semialdehyde 2,1-aminomutase [Diaporthe helianthi]|uniref:Glutamate-1-semialdehyde 2,1-aminomutase n=1 Tax=Diaporthe helianthi TaxID=158607 RepID=A0A2P5HXP2_DIAHE|nr:glutamate-1-semialdehyde 2,1-aminomutase [Diaporthe helianthi]